jgi:hypothetical protein
MVFARRLYRRVDEWSQTPSRAPYAVLIGVASALRFFGVSAVLGDAMIAGAVALGGTTTLLQYPFDPNRDEYIANTEHGSGTHIQ